jgi:hypothetical protein
MPIVPRYEQQVTESRLPNPRIPINPPTGGTMQASQQAGNATLNLVNNYVQQADDIAISEAYAKSMQAYNQAVYSDDDSLMNQRGKNAIGVTERTMQKYNKSLNDIESTLNPRQKTKFANAKTRLLSRINNHANRHEFDQQLAYDRENFELGIKESMTMIQLNFEQSGVVFESIEDAKQSIQQFADRNGRGKKWASSQIKSFESKAKSNVIISLLNTGDYLSANAVFDESKQSLLPEDHEKLKRAVDEGNRRQAINQIVSEAIQSPTEYEAIQAINKVSDPSVREGAKKIAKSHYTDLATAEATDLERISVEAFQKIQDNPNSGAKNVMSLMDYQTLSTKNPLFIKLLDSMGNKNNGKVDKYLAFTKLDVSEISNQTTADFLEYYANMDSDQKASALAIRQAAKDASDKSKKGGNAMKVKSLLTPINIANKTMDIAKIKRQEARYAIIKSVNDYYEFYQIENDGKTPSVNQVQTEVDRLLLEVEVDGLFIDPNKRIYELEDDDTITIENVPDRFIEASQQQFPTITRDQLQKAYTYYMTNPNRFNDYMAEITQ